MRNIPIPVVGKYYQNESEVDGHTILYSSILPSKSYSLNSVATKIWGQIKQRQNTNSILNFLCDAFPQVEPHVLESDLLRLLEKLWNAGFLSFEGVSPFRERYETVFADEYLIENVAIHSSHELISFYKEENTVSHVDAFVSLEEVYNEHKVDIELYHDICYAYLLKSKEKNVIAAIVFTFDKRNGIVSVSRLQYKEYGELIDRFVNKCIDITADRFGVEKQIRDSTIILFHAVHPVNRDTYTYLQRTGFSFVCTLKEESIQGDVDLYKKTKS